MVKNPTGGDILKSPIKKKKKGQICNSWKSLSLRSEDNVFPFLEQVNIYLPAVLEANSIV
jgi:hypothetical protein